MIAPVLMLAGLCVVPVGGMPVCAYPILKARAVIRHVIRKSQPQPPTKELKHRPETL